MILFENAGKFGVYVVNTYQCWINALTSQKHNTTETSDRQNNVSMHRYFIRKTGPYLFEDILNGVLAKNFVCEIERIV